MLALDVVSRRLQSGRKGIVMGNQKKNRGSAVVEMTLLIPILLGVFFLYICTFLFMIDSSKVMAQMSQSLYPGEVQNSADNTGENVYDVKKSGTKAIVAVKEQRGILEMDRMLSCYNGSAVKNIRRWQLATDILSTGEDESLYGNRQ